MMYTRKKTFLLACMFLAGFCAIYAGLLLLYHERIATRDNIFVQFAMFKNGAHTQERMFFGDSHAAYNVRGEVLPKEYYNFSYPGDNWQKIYLRMRTALKINPQLKYAIIPLDYHMFSPYRAEHDDFIEYVSFSDIEDIKSVYAPSRARLFKAWVSSIIPLVSPGNRIKLRIALGRDITALFTGEGNQKKINIDEWGNIVPTEDSVWTEISERKRRIFMADRIKKQFRDPLVDEDLFTVFKNFLAFAKEKGITVIGVRYPITSEYLENAKAYNLKDLDTRYNQLGIMVLDYRGLYDKHEEYFRDPDHLNTGGAVLFTKKLIVDLETALNPKKKK